MKKPAGATLAGSLADALEREIEREKAALEPLPTFLEFLTSPRFCGPYFAARGIEPAPVLQAIAAASEGGAVPVLTEEETRASFRCGRVELATGLVPKIVVIGAGRRGGKTSNLLAPKCVHAAWTVPLPTLAPGEIARAAIIAPIRDQAEAAFNYCAGIIEGSPVLSAAVVKRNTEEIVLRRPDGRLVEIVVGAANRGGLAGRSRTLVFCGLDEACFFYSDDGHTVNDQAIFDGVMGTLRFVEGAQCWVMSTPWIEGVGLMESFIAEHWGSPGDVLVAARISSYALRGLPDDGSLRLETDDDDTYRREILAIPMLPGAQSFFDPVLLAAAVTAVPPSGAPEAIGAGGDFAFERDSAAAAVVKRFLGGIFVPTRIEERKATPGDLGAQVNTIRELGAAVHEEGVNTIMADYHRRPFVQEHLTLEGVSFVDAPGRDTGKMETYGALKRVIAEGRFVLGALPRHVAEYVRDQLRAVVAEPISGPNGGFRIIAPRTKKVLGGTAQGRAGSHGDAVSALVLAAWQAGSWQTAASWQKPRVPSHARAEERPAARRPGAGGSLDFLRDRGGGRRR